MKTIDLKKANSPLADYVDRLQDGALVITRNGCPTAALVPLPLDMDLESFGLGTNPDFLKLLAESRQQLANEGGTPLAEVKREFGVKRDRRDCG